MEGKEGTGTQRAFALYRYVLMNKNSLGCLRQSCLSPKALENSYYLLGEDSFSSFKTWIKLPPLIFHIMPPCAFPDTEPKWLHLPKVHTSFHIFSHLCIVTWICMFICMWDPYVYVACACGGTMVMSEIFLDHAFMVFNEAGSLK